MKKNWEALVRMQKTSDILDAEMCHKISVHRKKIYIHSEINSSYQEVYLTTGRKKKQIIVNRSKCVCVSVQILSMEKLVKTSVLLVLNGNGDVINTLRNWLKNNKQCDRLLSVASHMGKARNFAVTSPVMT